MSISEGLFSRRWFVTEWSPCSKTCGRGSRTRSVICRQRVSSKEFLVSPDSACLAETKPVISSESEVCNAIICPADWIVISDWSMVRPLEPRLRVLNFITFHIYWRDSTFLCLRPVNQKRKWFWPVTSHAKGDKTWTNCCIIFSP